MTRIRRVLVALMQVRRREIALIVAFSIVAGLALGFGLLAEEVFEGDTAAFDRLILNALRSNGDLADPIGPAWVEEFARDITSLGSYAFLGLLVASLTGYLL